MQFQLRHKLTATPQGIFLDGEPLNKSTVSALPARSLYHIARACELMLKMTDKDWEPPAPHGPNDIPKRAQVEMHLALANPGSFNKGYPDQPRDCNGRWTCGDSAPSERQPIDTGKKSGKRFLSEKEAQPIAREAQSFADKRIPYKRGKQDENGADCSGSVFYIHNKAGYPIPSRESVAGFVDKVEAGKFSFDEIPKGSSPHIGDVIVFQGEGHMGIYAGQDKNGDDLMWAASTTAQAYIKQKIKSVGIHVMACYRYQITGN